MKKVLFLIIILFFTVNTFAQSQEWQWVNLGGTYNTYECSFYDQNFPIQLDFDRYGNQYTATYGISVLKFDSIDINIGPRELLLYSVTCDGQFRWLQRYSTWSNLPSYLGGVICDDNGDTYFVGYNQCSPSFIAHYGDTTIQSGGSITNGIFIHKLDSAGNTIYLTFPAPNGADAADYTLDISEDDNNIAVLTYFNTPTTWNQYSIPHDGFVVLYLDKNTGNLTNFIPLDMDSYPIYAPYYSSKFEIDAAGDIYLNFMVSTNDTIRLGNTIIPPDGGYKSFIAKFDVTGNFLWYNMASCYSTCSDYEAIRGKPVVSDSLVYITANTKSGANANFQGIPINNPIALDTNALVPIFLALDKNTGQIRYYNYIQSQSGSECAYSRIKVKDNKCYAVVSNSTISIVNQTDTVQPYSTSNEYPFILEMDLGLNHVNWTKAMRRLDEYGDIKLSTLDIDYQDNIYVGGKTSVGLVTSNNDTVHERSYSNFFIAKVATSNDSCGCPAAYPIASLVSTNVLDITVNCNARNILIDSAYVSWGDGDSNLCNSFNADYFHTYSHTGPWDICLTTYGACGVERYCMPSIDLTNLDEYNNNIKANIYPNPFNDKINIELNKNIFNAYIYIYNIVGEQIYNESFNGFKKSLDMSKIPAGIYIVKIISEQGNVVSRLIKE